MTQEAINSFFSTSEFLLMWQMICGSLEDTFREVVLLNNMEGVMFYTSLAIGGVGGATGKYYNTQLTKKIMENLR
jgi:hypothetical protein